MLDESLMKKRYYYDAEGKMENLYSRITNCFEQSIFLALKAKGLEKCIHHRLFLEDIALRVFTREDTFAMDINCFEQFHEFLEIDKYDNNLADPFEFLEKCLDHEKGLAVQTVFQLLPFNQHYNPDYNTSNFKPGHVFVLLGIKDDFLLFLENPASRNRKSFMPYQASYDIGVIHKSDVSNAFRHYLSVFSYEVSEEKIAKYNSRETDIVTLLKKIAENGRGICAGTGSIGIGAIEKLINICRSRNIRLNQTIPHMKHVDYLYLIQ